MITYQLLVTTEFWFFFPHEFSFEGEVVGWPWFCVGPSLSGPSSRKPLLVALFPRPSSPLARVLLTHTRVRTEPVFTTSRSSHCAETFLICQNSSFQNSKEEALLLWLHLMLRCPRPYPVPAQLPHTWPFLGLTNFLTTVMVEPPGA